jgi:hypothetical protein
VSFNAAALKLMLEKGLTLGDVVEIAAANELKRDPTASERMARMRERKRATRNVTRNPAPNDNILNPTQVTPPKPNGLDPTIKKHRLPNDWEPRPFTPGTLAAQTVLRWEPGRIERELSKFRDHHHAAGTRWENWKAAWSKWVNSSDDFQRGRHGQSTTPGIGKSAAAFQMLDIAPDETF